jgi:hypothetical protein
LYDDLSLLLTLYRNQIHVNNLTLRNSFAIPGDLVPIRKNERIGYDLDNTLDLHTELVFPVEFAKLIDTVVAGSDHDLGPGASDLVGLDSAGSQPPLGKPGHGQLPATATATEILLAVGNHLERNHWCSIEGLSRCSSMMPP